jgi:hypothetical protein
LTYSIALKKTPNNQLSIVGWKTRSPKRSKGESGNNSGQSLHPDGRVPAEGDRLDSTPLSLVTNSERTTIRCQTHSFRRTQFGKTARTRLFHAGGVCDIIDPVPKHYLFLTATLPGDDVWCKWAIAEYAHKLVDRLKSWLSKRMLDRKEFYVWEHQKRQALHLHYCLYVPDDTIRQRIADEFREEWVRLLDKVGYEVGVSLWGRHSEKTFQEKLALIKTEAAEVKWSVAKYLSGYVGGKGDKHGKDKYYDFYPKRWWGISRPLSKLIDEHSEKVVHEYSTQRDYQIAYDDFDHRFTADSLTRKKYLHKVGIGATTIFYYAPDTHKKLWLQKEMLQHRSHKHPNIYSLIREVSITLLSGRLIVQSSRKLQRNVSPQLTHYLEDVTLSASLGRCTLSRTHTRVVSLLHIELVSSLTYQEKYAPYLSRLTQLELLLAKAHPYLEWNKYGWLCNSEDIPIAIDKFQYLSQGSTTPPDG